MAIRIQERKPEIPVEIGPLKFSFEVTDESVLEFRKKAIEIQKELEELKVDENKQEDLEACKDVLRRGFDLLLGDGAFEKIYKLTPSVVILMDYLAQLADGINEELRNMGATTVLKRRAEKYIGKRK